MSQPLKAKVAEVLSDKKAYSAENVFRQLSQEYPGEKYCSPPVIAEHLKSLKAVGIVTEDSSYIDDSGNLVSMYRITEYGMGKVQKMM